MQDFNFGYGSLHRNGTLEFLGLPTVFGIIKCKKIWTIIG